ncbi:MAG: T9SS type A sorting domain-containing protein [Microscillaceae bacterium]|nr:T9SS type A sorting domain-containing protein [Microscillaceae bacterium]
MNRINYIIKFLFKNLIAVYLALAAWDVSAQNNAQSSLYDDCSGAIAGNLLDLTTVPVPSSASFTNSPISLAGATTSATASPASCVTQFPAGPPPSVFYTASPPVTFTALQDAWIRFRAPATGPLVITYTPTSTANNVALIVYNIPGGGCPAVNNNEILQCGNAFGAGFTESITVSATANVTYLLRIINVNNSTTIAGNISFYAGPAAVGDLCTDADGSNASTEVTVGTCGLPYNVSGSFLHNERNTTVPCGGTIQTESWLRVNIRSNRRIRIQYRNANKDAAIIVYQGAATACNTLAAPTVCSNSVAGAGLEAVEFNSPAGVATATTAYLIRIANVQDAQTMDGELCITELIGRDNCLSTFNDYYNTSTNTGVTPVGIAVGNCNVRLDVPGGSDATNAAPQLCSEDASLADAWTIFRATATQNVRLEYNSINNSNPALLVYDFGTTTTLTSVNDPDAVNFCVPGPSSVLACNTAVGAPSAAVSFQATNGRLYAIRVIRDTGTELLGSLCLYADTKRAEDDYYTANTYLLDGSDCTRQFNLLASFNDKGGQISENGLPDDVTSCSNGSVSLKNDAWATFTTPAAIPAGGYVLEYNNDNNDPSVANDIAVLIYRGINNATPPLATAANTCATATTNMTPNSTIATFVVPTGVDWLVPNDDPNTSCRSYAAGQAKGDAWVRFTAPSNDPFVVIYQSNTGDNGDASIELYDGCGGTFLQCINSIQGGGNTATGAERLFYEFSSAGTTYFIRIVNNANNVAGGTMTGRLSVYSSLALTTCVNNVVEGLEELTLDASNLLPNTQYFIRVANVVTSNAPNSTTGTLCIRPNTLIEGDICTNAIEVAVGDCGVDFSLTTAFSQRTNVTTPPAPCAGGSGTGRDGWLRFTATSTQTTIEYFNTTAIGNQNAVISIYRGTCNGLVYVGCSNSVAPNTAGVERVRLSTIPGIQYFIRVHNVFASPTTLDGQYCIYNTAERDVCSDGDLVTKNVGECNIRFDIPRNFGPSPSTLTLRNFLAGQSFPIAQNGGSIKPQNITTSCETENPFTNTDTNPGTTSARDAWMRLIGDGKEVTIFYQNGETTSNPMIAVYTALQAPGPVNCGAGADGAGNPLNQYACGNVITTAGFQTESVTFQTNAGQLYLIRLVDLASIANTDMTGLMCISTGKNTYEDACLGLRGPRQVEVGQCSVPLNVIPQIGANDASGNTCFDPQIGVNNQPIGDSAGSACRDCNTASGQGDAWAYFIRPIVCTPPTGAQLVPPCSGPYVLNSAGTQCQCPTNSITTGFPNQITVQYDNSNGIPNTGSLPFSESADVKLAVYRINDIANCNTESSYTLIDCKDDISGEGRESVRFNVANGTVGNGGLNPTNPNEGGYYLIRIINKSNTRVSFGNICVFWGNDMGDAPCTNPTDYGNLTGEYVNMNTPGTPNNTTYPVPNNNPNIPSTTIPNCVIPGVKSGSGTTNGTDPIRAHAWMQFTVPATADYRGVTVQYDNFGFSNQRNMAVAVYLKPPTFTTCSDLNNPGFAGNPAVPIPSPLNCVNSVTIGAESVTIGVNPGSTYFVRLMNLDNGSSVSPSNGKIRVFPFAVCTINPAEELITDGNFANWPAIQRSVAIDNFVDNGTNFDTKQDQDVHRVPSVTATNTYPNSLDNVPATGMARFATDYGFLRDRTSAGNLPSGGINATTARYGQLRTEQYELGPEGFYLVKQSPWTVKGDWFCFGNGYSGYGGRLGGGTPQASYCATGGLGKEPCSVQIRQPSFPNTIGAYNPQNGDLATAGANDRPAPWPTTSEANFMIINGSYDPASTLPPGKIWCQTVTRSAGQVDYYVFTVWVQNMISTGRNLDLPALRLTVCDMENPERPNEVPTNFGVTGTSFVPANPQTVTLSGSRTLDIGNGAQANSFTTRLPGFTRMGTTNGNIANPLVVHHPAPPTDRVKAPRVDFSYGAASSCNLSGENQNARLKTLSAAGRSTIGYIVTEDPDQWILLRCIYRAPIDVTNMNICIENLSVTKNGNDIGIDDIDFRRCEQPDVEAFDRMLKGDPCELSNNPEVFTPLPVSYLDFTGKLVGDRVLLNWITLLERNTKHFEIQRSIDGTKFSGIGIVDAKGTAGGMANYNYTDRELPLGVKFLYYRLVNHDFDGTSKTGPIISIAIEGLETFDMKLSPNPIIAGEDVKVQFNVAGGKTGIAVYDMLGAPLMAKVIDTFNGDNELYLNTKGMQAGIYIVRVVNNGRATSRKLIVR